MHLSATIVTAFWPFQVPTYLYVFCVDAFTDKFFAKIYFGPTSFWESGLLEWSIYLYWFSLPQAYNYLLVDSNVQYLLLLYSGTCGCVGVVLHYWRCSSSIGKNSNTFFYCLCSRGYRSARSIKCCCLGPILRLRKGYAILQLFPRLLNTTISMGIVQASNK